MVSIDQIVIDNIVESMPLGLMVINAKGEIVGLIFDGDIESLVGDFVYDGEANRAVAVHTAAMTEALRKLYGAQKLVDELLGQ